MPEVFVIISTGTDKDAKSIYFLVNNELYATGEFDKLDEADDEKEHSIELHLPYIAKVMER